MDAILEHKHSISAKEIGRTSNRIKLKKSSNVSFVHTVHPVNDLKFHSDTNIIH